MKLILVALIQGTVSSQKHEMLFKSFGVNYNEIDARFRKGSILVRDIEDVSIRRVVLSLCREADMLILGTRHT